MKTIITTALILLTNLAFSQYQTKLNYQDVYTSVKKSKGKFDSYLSEDSTLYSVGDTIRFGSKEVKNVRYITVEKVKRTENVCVAGMYAKHGYAVIRTIKVGGNKRIGHKAKMVVDGLDLIYNYFMYIDGAVYEGDIIFDIR